MKTDDLIEKHYEPIFYDEQSKNKHAVHFMSKSNEWETPPELYNQLDLIYQFDLDPCATHQNKKCKKYFTIDDDGLSQKWFGNVFVNPPYGRELKKWVRVDSP